MKYGHSRAEQHNIASDLCSLPEELRPCLMKLARLSESPLVVSAASQQCLQIYGDFTIGVDEESQLDFARELLHCLVGDTSATLDACDCQCIDELEGHITRIFELHLDGVPLYRCGVSLGSEGEVVRRVTVVAPSLWPDKEGTWAGEAVARGTVEQHRGLHDVPADWVLGRARRMWFSAAITHGMTHGEAGEPDWVPAWVYSMPQVSERPTDVVVAADGSSLIATIALGDIKLGLAPLPRFLLRPESDVPAFISWGQAGLLLPAASTGDAASVARSLFDRFPTLFGTGDSARQLQLVRTDVSSSWPRTRHVVFQQVYGGVPVHGCQVRVHLAPDLAIRCVTGCYLRDPQVSLDVKVSEFQAQATLPGRVDNQDDRKGWNDLPVKANGLVVFPAVLAPRGGAVNHLTWWFTTPEHHHFVSAESGRHVYALPARQDARYTYDANQRTRGETLDVQDGRTVTAGGMAPDPDSLPMDSAVGRFEGFLLSLFGWRGWNGVGADHIAIVDYPNDGAFWEQSDHRARFGRNFTTAPIVGHEFAHGVTQATCNLKYIGEPGALNESFSDVICKLAFPGTPPDWKVLRNDGSLVRDLAAPAVDRYSLLNNQPLGGFSVHSNSGIGNRCAVLFCDGDGTPAHPAAGRELTARLWWDLHTLFLHPWSRYIEFSLVMRQLVRDFAAAGTLGVAAPASAAAGGAQLPVFDNTTVAAADAALDAVELSPRLHSGWFTIPGTFSRTHTFFSGGLVAANEVVSAAEVLVVRQRDADKTQFLFGRAVSPSAPTFVDQSGTLVVKITASGVGTRSKQMTVDIQSIAGVETELKPTVYTSVLTTAPAAPPPEIIEWPSPVIAHWFDNPFFAGRRYGDLIYETVGVDAATCSILDVWLEILERRNGQYLPRGQARLGGPAVTWGGTGVTLVEAHPGTALLEAKVRSWHDFGQCVRYRLVYVISGGCIPTAFGSRAVDPFTFV